jgi:hypothetical protein
VKRLGLLFLIVGLTAPAAVGQSPSWKRQVRQLAPVPDLASNQVEVLAPAGDSLWIGPLLTVYLEPEDRSRPEDRLLSPDVEAIDGGDNVVFALEARNASPARSLVWAGLAFDTGGGVAGAGGFLVSTDGGSSFTERPAQLDAPSDSTVAYGRSTLPAVPITQRRNSAPQDLAFGPRADTVWVAGGRSGIRWVHVDSTDWNRAVLPPDTSRTVDPATPTDVLVAPPLDDGRGSLNHVGFSVLVDETGTVWAGTGAGVNRARPASVTDDGRREWRRFGVADTTGGLTGTFAVALDEQPRPGRNPIWMATWARQQQDGPLQRFGVTVTPDGGDTFRQTLIGERVFDLAARTDRVYAAGETGLFVSDDQGQTWRSIEDFPLQNDDRVLPPEVSARSVAVTDAALWVGTSDGLLRLDRTDEPRLLTGAPAWQLFRAEAPVNPENPSEAVPDVSTYAYPNPFVPSDDQLVRIVYELQEARTVEVTVFDYGMNRVWSTTQQKVAGQRRTRWDGTDEQGLRVPTGTYFYRVEFGDTTVQGKILLAN